MEKTLRLGFDMAHLIHAQAERVARDVLAQEWAKRGGGEYTEAVSVTESGRSVDWIEVQNG